ncbi:MAG TPA: hypothetical protein VLG10_13505 [Methylomirabilota bacterium]|nr:hypothetical protein [Methylomirabilota bacterium]
MQARAATPTKEARWPRLASIAHDNKKVDLVAWATFNRDNFARFELIATRHTARLVREKVGLDGAEVLSGPEGGDAQIAARVAEGSVDALQPDYSHVLHPALARGNRVVSY